MFRTQRSMCKLAVVVGLIVATILIDQHVVADSEVTCDPACKPPKHCQVDRKTGKAAKK